MSPALKSEGKTQKYFPRLIAQANSDNEQQQLIDEATRLNQQIIQLYQQGRFSEAIPIAERTLRIREKVLGAEHLDVATSLNNLAGLFRSQGLYSKAEPLYQRALSTFEKALGSEHSKVATSLNNLAALYLSQGLYSKADPLFQRALSIFEKALGAEHPMVATSLNNLAGLFRSQGLYAKAEPLYQRALRIREKALGTDHPDVAQSLNNLALLYASQGLYPKAKPLYQRTLKILENVFGADNPSIASSLNNLALLYSSQGLYTKAALLYQRALSIREKALGASHPDMAQSLSNLAGLYTSQGLYTKAAPLSQRALSIREKALGANHPDIAQSLHNLANLYYFQGLYAEAIPLAQRALSINEKAFGTDHPSVATSLNNLATLYTSEGLYPKADPLYQRALRINEKAFGIDHPSVATSLNNLASLYYFQGLYPKATLLYQNALSIREKQLGANHPSIATSLNNLASLYYFQGLYRKATPLYQRALRINAKAFGTDHPSVANILNNLASLYNAQKNLPLSHKFRTRASDIEELNLDLILATSSEVRKRAYIATLSVTTDATISVSFQDAPKSLSSAQLALKTILLRKGRVLASLTNTFQTLRQNLSPTDRPLLDQLTTIRSKRATLTFQGPGSLPPNQYRTTLTQLKTQEDELENQLARKSVEFRVEAQPVTIAAVQKQIPQGAALVELVKYQPFDSQAIQQETKWGAPHYTAYILKADGDLQWLDLGAAQPIDQAVTRFRQALKSGASNIIPIARNLDQQLMKPIRAKLGNTKQLLLSPDSQLNLIPFAALVDENNQYLVENYDITYLSSGRDLLKLDPTVQKKRKLQAPVIIADPDYQKPGATKIAAAKTSENRSSRDLSLTFGPLPGTKAEANQLHKLLPQSKLLTQSQATENALKQVQSPEILHIATHGFFLETDLDAAPNPKSDRASISVVSQARPHPKRTNYENPLLRSGLALAGANPRQSGAEDGIFTALEATGLNLQGTQLVVLSACETGLGDIANGEGVYGLRRAFVMAGAESQVLSLWKVSDAGTKDLMVNYYQRLLKKEGRSEALRQTQLEMLNSSQYSHPFYWAAFIPSGDWRSLR